MSVPSCISELGRFLEEVTGRLSFEETEKHFSKALNENPVFAEIERSGALGKNVVVILGGRGCGKTLALRYAKHKLSGEGWDFRYLAGPDLAELAEKQGREGFQQILEEHDSELSREAGRRLVLAIDDIAEAVEVAKGFLQKAIGLVRKHEGRLKLILAAQSERKATLELLKVVLPEAPCVEMFFGEEPGRRIVESFRKSYVSRRPVTSFRGAAIINLDAYWSSLRALDKVEELAEAIAKLAEFYAKNANSENEDCYHEVLNEVDKCKRGLALLALSSTPRIVGGEIIVEYQGTEPALNGLGIAELLRKFFADPEERMLAQKAEEMYSELKKLQTASVDVDSVKEALLKSCNVPSYGLSAFSGVPVKSLIPAGTTGQGGRRSYGPRADVIEVNLEARGERGRKLIILHSLKTDRKGYVTRGSIKKLEELIQLGVPSENQMRYLAVLIPAKRCMVALYKALGPAGIDRKGRDVIPLLADKLTSAERALVHLIAENEDKIPPELKEAVQKIVVGNLIFSLRDDSDAPWLSYLILPSP